MKIYRKVLHLDVEENFKLVTGKVTNNDLKIVKDFKEGIALFLNPFLF